MSNTVVEEEKKAEAKEGDKPKRFAYEYKSWSLGLSVPEGWERCPGYDDVIRRLKVEPPEAEDIPAETESAEVVDEAPRKEDNKGQCSCC